MTGFQVKQLRTVGTTGIKIGQVFKTITIFSNITGKEKDTG